MAEGAIGTVRALVIDASKLQKSRTTIVMSSIELAAVKQSPAHLTCFVLVRAALPQVARDDGLTHQPVPLA